MRVALFIPCFMDQFYPNVAMASLQVLEKFGCEVEYPMDQTCCGQPMANSGCNSDAKGSATRFVELFKDYDYVVSPSGSCSSMVKNHYRMLLGKDNQDLEALIPKTFEFCEFLTDVLKVEKIDAKCSAKVGLHKACHGLRELRLGQSSERCTLGDFSKPGQLLNMVEGLEMVQISRPDECCGFGGTFAVAEEDVSCLMGKMKVEDFEESGTQIVVSTDSSCIMHMSGLSSRQKKNLKFAHIAEILNGDFA